MLWILSVITTVLVSQTMYVEGDYYGYDNDYFPGADWRDDPWEHYEPRNNSYFPVMRNRRPYRDFPNFPQFGNFFGDFLVNGEWGSFRFWRQPERVPLPQYYEPEYHREILFEDFEKNFREMSCRFENLFLKDFSEPSHHYHSPRKNKMLLLDLSSQMSKAEMTHIKESLSLMVDNMCVPPNSAHEFDHTHDTQTFTLITNNDNIKHYHSESKDVEKIKQDIYNINGHRGVTCVTTLLKKAYSYIDKYQDKSKTRIEHDVLLITDGRSTCKSPYHTEALKLRSVAHVSVITIIKKDGTKKKIKVTDIATDSSAKNVYSFKSCGAFLGMMKHINDSPCRKCPAF